MIAYLRSQPIRSISIREPSSFTRTAEAGCSENSQKLDYHAQTVMTQPAGGAGVTALIDAVLADSEASATMKRLAALAKAEVLSSALPTRAQPDKSVSSFPPPPNQPPLSGALFSLSGDASSPRLPVSVTHTSVGGEISGNLMHPY